MGFILVVAVLSLAIFVSISNTVFSLVAPDARHVPIFGTPR
jgi:hypothetical protein